MRLIDADSVTLDMPMYNSFSVGMPLEERFRIMLERQPTVDAIPIWYIIRWYEKRYRLGSTVTDDCERAILKERIAKMHDDFKNEKYLDNKQESERYAQMVKEVIDLYNDWEKENE